MHSRYLSRIMGTVFVLAAIALTGCAHNIHDLSKPVRPGIRFLSFNSVSIQPTGVRFIAKMEIKNNMPVSIPLDRVDYRFELNQKTLATGTFDKFSTLKGRGRKVVSFPFHIAFEDIAAHALASEKKPGYHVNFNGNLYLGKGLPFAAIPFRIAKIIPVPKLPEVRMSGTEGSPLEGKFVVNLDIKNANRFPIWIKSVNTKMEMNRKNYELFQSGAVPRLEPGETQTLSMEMTNPVGKGIGILANVLISGKMDFKVGGDLKFGTPFGDIYLPLNEIASRPR